MTTYALRLENSTDTAARVRMGELLSLPLGDAPLKSRSALRADGGGAVTVVAGSMNVSVAPFIAWVQGGISTVQGGYPFVHDAAVTLAIGPGHASLARVDTLVGIVRDNAFDSSGQVLAGIIVVPGTPGAGAPALPTNAVALRDINVPAGLSAGNGGLQASNLGTDRRVYLNPSPVLLDVFVEAAANTSISTAAWIPESSGGISGSFVAPASGAVKVSIGALLSTNGANVRMDYGMRWTGGVTRNPLGREMIGAYAAGSGVLITIGRTFTVTGLTPGMSYTLTSALSSGAAAGSVGVGSRNLLVEAL